MTEDFKRKLTAILSADVEGYSRLMGEDEDSTVRTLTSYRNLISSLIERYHGQVVDSPGDNLLAEFESVRDAVLCAVEIQEELKIRNAGLPDSRKMQFRIGINLGDIIKEEGRIYGDGVNVAARIESLADAGGICLSSSAYDQVKKKLNYEYEHLGEYEVKNIDEPVSVYKVLMVSKAADKVVEEKKIIGGTSLIRKIAIVILVIIAGLLVWEFYPDQPKEQAPKTIAVLPFEDLSPKKDQEHFVLGLSEEILNSLTHIPDLTVIARTSSFSFKGQNKTVQEIAKELGADHILEGSVRKYENDIRITAQLIKADDESHLWSENYDRELKDIIIIQEDIASNVADKLKLTLEAFRTLGGTKNIDAYELYLNAKGQNNINQKLESIDKAIDLDPEFALAYAYKALQHLWDVNFAIEPSSLALDLAMKSAQKAVDIEPRLGKAHLSLGFVYLHTGEFTKAEKAYQTGMSLTTESIDYFSYGLCFYYLGAGYLDKSNDLLEKIRLNNPREILSRSYYVLSLGLTDGIEKAEEEYENCKSIFGDPWFGIIYITFLRFGANKTVPIGEIPEYPESKTWTVGRNNFKVPKKGITELRQLFNNNDDLSVPDLRNMARWAAYFGDPELALKAIEESFPSGFLFIWLPVMKEVRQLPRFKEYVREIGLVDYWKEYGWPDLCHPVGDDDFECDKVFITREY